MFRNRSLSALLVAELVSTTGMQMTFVALPWFVLVTTDSLAKMSYVLAAEILPIALFGIPSGALVGRLGARRTMILSDLIRAPLIALVPVLHWTGTLDFWLLLAIVFVLGLFSAPYFAAQRTIVPELFGNDETLVAQAQALIGGATHVTMIVGPALAGILIAWLGAPAVLMIDAATYLVAVVLVAAFVRGGAPIPADDDARGVLAGVRFLARDRILGPLTLTVILLDLAANALFLALPALAFVRYDQNPHVAGWLFSLFGVGALAGTIVAMKALEKLPPLRLAGLAILCSTVGFWLMAIRMPWPGVGAAMLLIGIFIPLVNAPAMGLLSTRPPDALRAKVMTAVMTASALGAPVGRIAVGPLFEGWGISRTFLLVAAVFSVGAVCFAAVALSSREEVPVDSVAWD